MPQLQSTPICAEAMPSPIYAAAPGLSSLGPSSPNSPASPSFTSPLHLRPNTQCWTDILNTGSGFGSPCSKLQPSVDFRKKSKLHILELQSPRDQPPTPPPASPHAQTPTPPECQVTANVLVSSNALTFPPPHLCVNPSPHWKRLLSAFKYT